MILPFGICLWIVAALVLIRLVRIGCASGPDAPPPRVLWAAVVAAAILLMFRPHEDILGGQDPGSYLNSAATYARENRLVYVDPLLAQVPAPVRRDFLYGHEGYGATKDGCVWLRDMNSAQVGVHFQPAYPLMMSVVAKGAAKRWILFVAPLFTVFTALALAAIAAQLFRHRWAGFLAFLLYVASPLVIWHGRCPRPEVLASFFFFGGWALLLHGWGAPRWRRWADTLMGAIGISLAPFFHVTAWFLVIPTAAVWAVVAIQGRDDFWIPVSVAALGAVAFVGQTLFITDPYVITRFIEPILARHPVVWTIAGGGLALVAAGFFRSRRRASGRLTAEPDSSTVRSGRVVEWLVATVFAAACLLAYFLRAPLSDRPPLVEPVYHYIYPSDLRVVTAILSPPVALLALLGVIALAAAHQAHRPERIALIFSVAPATLLAGRMTDFFTTRYMMVSMMPLAAIGMTALVTAIPQRRWWSGGLTAVAAAVIVAAGLAGRTHLIRTTEHKGLVKFLQPFAEKIRQPNGILLCEYSRLGAPLEHLFGIPTLDLDNEHNRDYTAALAAWDGILRAHPDRPAFFLTPFQAPVSERFVFQPVLGRTFRSVALKEARYEVPKRISCTDLKLSLYSMRSVGAGEGPPKPAAPFVCRFDAGNMGLVNFASVRTKSWPMAGRRLGPDTPVAIVLPPVSGGMGQCDFFLFCLVSGQTAEAPHFTAPAAARMEDRRWEHLANNWWLLRASDSGLHPGDMVLVRSDSELLLTDVQVLAADQPAPLPIEFGTDATSARPSAIPMTARWTRAESRCLLPMPGGPRGYVLALLQAPRGSGAETARVTMTSTVIQDGTRIVPTGRWVWGVWPVASSNGLPDTAWLSVRTEPLWNPEQKGYPQDLGVLLGWMVVVGSD
jgi:hypothetical protein